jgi:hypothetical protein
MKFLSVERTIFRTFLALLCAYTPLHSQVVTVDAGQGMSGEPSGGVVGVNFGKWELDSSAGNYNGNVELGAALKAQLGQRFVLKAGDQTIDMGLPTQLNLSARIMARGASVKYTPSPRTNISIFGGMAGEGYASTNVLFFNPQIPLGALTIEHFLDPERRFKLFTQALFSNQQTALAGVMFQSKRLQAGIAGGIGSNQPHGEGLLHYTSQKIDLRSAYLYSGTRFQLLTMPQLRLVQQDRENVDLIFSATKSSRITIARHNYLSPRDNGLGSRGSSDSLSGFFRFHRITLGAEGYESRYEGTYASASSYSLSYQIAKPLFLSGNYYMPLHSERPIPLLVLNLREDLNRRVQFTQFASQVNGQWNVNYGGSVRWDRVDFNLGYTTNFVPLAAGGGRFEQSMALNGHLNLGRWQLGARTFAQPNGRILYGYEIRTFYFHPTGNGNISAPSSRLVNDFPNFLIIGNIVLEYSGLPVADVPVRIGEQIVYSDGDGSFSLRVNHATQFKVRPVLDRQIGAHYYEAVSGSDDVKAGTDTDPGRVQYVLRIDTSREAKLSGDGILIRAARLSAESPNDSPLAVHTQQQSIPGGLSNQTSPVQALSLGSTLEDSAITPLQTDLLVQIGHRQVTGLGPLASRSANWAGTFSAAPSPTNTQTDLSSVLLFGLLVRCFKLSATNTSAYSAPEPQGYSSARLAFPTIGWDSMPLHSLEALQYPNEIEQTKTLRSPIDLGFPQLPLLSDTISGMRAMNRSPVYSHNRQFILRVVPPEALSDYRSNNGACTNGMTGETRNTSSMIQHVWPPDALQCRLTGAGSSETSANNQH